MLPKLQWGDTLTESTWNQILQIKKIKTKNKKNNQNATGLIKLKLWEVSWNNWSITLRINNLHLHKISINKGDFLCYDNSNTFFPPKYLLITFTTVSDSMTNWNTYSRINQVKLVKENFIKVWSDMVYIQKFHPTVEPLVSNDTWYLILFWVFQKTSFGMFCIIFRVKLSI